MTRSNDQAKGERNPGHGPRLVPGDPTQYGGRDRRRRAAIPPDVGCRRRGRVPDVPPEVEALAACRLSIGVTSGGGAVTVDAKPIKRFEAWLHNDGDQQTLWPGYLELSNEFYETLEHHAVPLDYRALSALKHSALALDVYTWLAHRLCRVTSAKGTMLSWQNLRDRRHPAQTVAAADPQDEREFRPVPTARAW